MEEIQIEGLNDNISSTNISASKEDLSSIEKPQNVASETTSERRGRLQNTAFININNAGLSQSMDYTSQEEDEVKSKTNYFQIPKVIEPPYYQNKRYVQDWIESSNNKQTKKHNCITTCFNMLYGGLLSILAKSNTKSTPKNSVKTDTKKTMQIKIQHDPLTLSK